MTTEDGAQLGNYYTEWENEGLGKEWQNILMPYMLVFWNPSPGQTSLIDQGSPPLSLDEIS